VHDRQLGPVGGVVGPELHRAHRRFQRSRAVALQHGQVRRGALHGGQLGRLGQAQGHQLARARAVLGRHQPRLVHGRSEPRLVQPVGLLEVGQRFGQPAVGREGLADALVHLGVLGLEVEGARELQDRLLDAVLLEELLGPTHV
jgi:hypothetical protein